MSSFICENCGCIDNTAMNNSYHSRNLNLYNDVRILCQVCSPKVYKDGTPVEEDSWCGNVGEWHNKFERTHWSEIGKDEILRIYNLKNGSYINAIEYFKGIGEKV